MFSGAGFISAFYVTKASVKGGIWPPAGQPRLPIEETLINTFALLMSGYILYLANKNFSGNKLKKSFIRKLLTFISQLGKEILIGFIKTGSGSGAAIIVFINSGFRDRVVIAVKAPNEFPINITLPLF